MTHPSSPAAIAPRSETGASVMPGTSASAVRPAQCFAVDLRANLVDELERVVARRERFRAYGVEAGLGFLMEPSIAIMTAAIDSAKAALAGRDPIDCGAALRGLGRISDDG